MDPKLLRNYRAEQRKPVFMRDLPEPKVRERLTPLRIWLIIAGLAVLVALIGLIGFPHP